MKNAESLTIDELIQINSDAIKNFKKGDRSLLDQRVRDNPTGNINYEDYDPSDMAIELIQEIAQAACSSSAEGVGLIEFAKNQFMKLHSIE